MSMPISCIQRAPRGSQRPARPGESQQAWVCSVVCWPSPWSGCCATADGVVTTRCWLPIKFTS
eukprot:9160366-Alexandrium_andersonii.AAC.1